MTPKQNTKHLRLLNLHHNTDFVNIMPVTVTLKSSNVLCEALVTPVFIGLIMDATKKYNNNYQYECSSANPEFYPVNILLIYIYVHGYAG